MRLITKGPEPNLLTRYRAGGGAYADLSASNGKDVIKRQLLEEQHHCCAYCTSRIKLSKTKLEHWWPQSLPPLEGRLDYANMLACCSGKLYIDGNYHFHCDTSKGDTVIAIDPRRPDHIERIRYRYGTGKLESLDASHQRDFDDVDRLNLNHPEHQRRRREALNTFKLAFLSKNRQPNFIKLLRDFQASRRPYEDIIIAYLKRKVERNL